MSDDQQQPDASTPANQASEGAGNGGVVPPIEHRFKPGKSGNPVGRPSAGASILEWINSMRDWKEKKVRATARSKRSTWTKRAAAERILRAIEAGDLADFDAIIKGEKTLAELRAAGVNTEIVKKIKAKETVTKAGELVKETEIELHDRAGQDFDRIVNNTFGKPVPADVEKRIAALETALLEKKP